MDYVALSLVAAPCATFGSTLLRGFQNKAVAANNKKQAFIVGSVMNACDVLVIATIAMHASVWIVILSALGAGSGWTTGMKIHDRINYRRRQEIKQRKKEKYKRRVLEVVNEVLKSQ